MSKEIKTTSIYEMLTRSKHEKDYIDKIVIPRIQRDYAQGRKDKKVSKIRSRFFKKLIKAIASEDAKPIILDFVYGSREDAVFYPLDGQQRLTTLFLLHWYSAVIEYNNVKTERPDFLNGILPILSKFTYLTRDSAGEFLHDLLYKFQTPDFSVALSSQIKDSPWFPLSWNDDPTVAGMLVALDTFQQLFNEYKVSGAWSRLTEDNKITFHCKFIGDMGVTDTIYIKMNSRGLPLTDFEHFKTELESRLAKLHEQERLSTNILNGYKTNLDKDWTDMLWRYRNKDYDNDPEHYMDNAIDKCLMRLIKYFFDMLSYKKGYPLKDNLFDTLDEILSHDDCADEIVDLYNWLNQMSGYADLAALFDAFLTTAPFAHDKIYVPISAKQYYGVNFFEGCVRSYGESKVFPYSAMLYFEAFVVYLLHKDQISDEAFADRLRIIRNLIANTPYIHEDDLQHMLLEVDEIVLNDYKEGFKGFNENQEKQEWLKYTWINQKIDDENSRLDHCQAVEKLKYLENHDMQRGNVGVLLKNDANEFDMSLFTPELVDNFYILFGKDVNLNLTKLAILSQGDYGFTDGWRTFYAWASRVSWYDDIFSSYKKGTPSGIIRKTLAKLSTQSVSDLAATASSTTVFDWRYYMSKYSIIRNGPQEFPTKGVYYWNDRHNKPYSVIQMYTQKSTNGRHWNPFMLALHKAMKYAEATLDVWNSPIRVPNPLDTGTRLNIWLSNSHLYVRNDDRQDVYGPFDIPMSDGIDNEDRITWSLAVLKDNGIIP